MRHTPLLLPTIALATAATSLLATALAPKTSPDGAHIPELTAFGEVVLGLPDGLPTSVSMAIPFDGGVLDVNLVTHSVRSADFTALVDVGGNTLVSVEAPAPRTYRGSVAGYPESRVAASLLESGLSGVILLDEDTTLVVQPITDFLPDFDGADGTHVIFRASDAIAPVGFCANLLHDMTVKQQVLAREEQAGGGRHGDSDGGIAGTTPSICDISCDTDYEFFTANGSSVNNTIADVELIINGIDTIYDRDVNIIFEIVSTVVRSASADPYTTTTIDGRLGEVETVFSASPYSSIPDDVVHLFSGYNFSGGTIGLAWLGVVCNGGSNYGVVESRYTSSLNYRLSLSAHELGHNWDATHCDSQGTAACHIMCSSNGGCGGISGSNLKFDALTISEVTTYKNQVGCDATAAAPAAPPFSEDWASTSISAARWSYNKGGTATAAAANEPSAQYSLNLDSSANSEFGDDEIRSARIDMAGLSGHELRYWVSRAGVESGKTLTVQYVNSSMHWITVNTITSDGVNPTGFTEHAHVLPSTAHHADARIRFVVDGDDSSDDWFIDNIRVQPPGVSGPDNDSCGSPTVVTLGSTVFDSAGASLDLIAVPTQCNEAGAGLVGDVWFKFTGVCDGAAKASTCGTVNFDTKILVYEMSSCPTSSLDLHACDDDAPGCSLGSSEVEFSMIQGQDYLIRLGGRTTTGSGTLTLSLVSCGTPCPADLSGDGNVDGVDIGILLAGWGNASGDINGDGVTDGIDLASLLSGFGACP